MKIIQEKKEEADIIYLEGRLDLESSKDFQLIINEKIRERKKNILIDCGKLEYISSAGLRVILDAVKQFDAIHGKIIFCCLTVHVKEIFEISGLASIFKITGSIEEGLKVFLSYKSVELG